MTSKRPTAKRAPGDIRVSDEVRRAERTLRLKGWEKRRMREKIERWLEECQLDMYVDKDQMWQDTIIIRGHCADCLPIAMIHMITGWEPFVHAEEMLGQEETALFYAIFKEPNDPPR